MKKLLVLLATLFILTGCSKSSGEPTVIESTIGSVTKSEFQVYEDEGIFLVKIYDKDIDKSSKNVLMKDTGEMLASLSKIEEVKSVAIKWYAPPFDQSDKKDFEEILAIRFEADTFETIDWENNKTLDLESIASRYKQNDSLKD
ncbi:hypothetical protein [Psychrobacillus sp. MER TA 171]|uniref:hypothetical protein n=1 Tax=Psychrobacillus sp. MER TA 171 TaxID=2939577 RepID=UPI00203FE0AB|nr:hypothetical protein [Psychrobacillus sp. MER TA 171]MCM3359817.1 hypothetical protein [Psychrobacillus sp. MER TA 171]